jgi:hypothetical protein
MLEAHEALVKTALENLPKFKDVIQFLEEELHLSKQFCRLTGSYFWLRPRTPPIRAVSSTTHDLPGAFNSKMHIDAIKLNGNAGTLPEWEVASLF